MFLKNRFGKRPIALAVAAAITPALASTAFAQTSRGASAMMEEVVVTATKRAENLQDVPVSVQALTGDSLRAQSIMTFDAKPKSPIVHYFFITKTISYLLL